MRRALDRLRDLGDPFADVCRSRFGPHAGDFGRRPGRSASLSAAPIRDHCDGRRRHIHHRLGAARPLSGDRLRHRRAAVGIGRFHRHECLGQGQCAGGAGRHQVAVRRSRPRLQGRRRHRSPGRRPGAARGHALFRLPGRDRRLRADRPHGGRLAGVARLRRLADLDLRASGRRHLHQGRRCRRRHGRQGGSRDPGGRSAQPRDHRRQCRRQCRRLRRHGGGSVRDLCGDRGRHHGARGDHIRPAGAAAGGDALSAGDRRGLRRDLDHRHLLRPARRQQLDHGRALSRLHRLGGAVARGAVAGDHLDLGRHERTADRGRAQLHADAPVLVRPGRA